MIAILAVIPGGRAGSDFISVAAEEPFVARWSLNSVRKHSPPEASEGFFLPPDKESISTPSDTDAEPKSAPEAFEGLYWT